MNNKILNYVLRYNTGNHGQKESRIDDSNEQLYEEIQTHKQYLSYYPINCRSRRFILTF